MAKHIPWLDSDLNGSIQHGRLWNVVRGEQVTDLSTNLQLVSPSPGRTGSQLGISGYEVRRLTCSETRAGEQVLLLNSSEISGDVLPPQGGLTDILL